ncbi:MAG TPA: hypothetical protein VG079_06545 [Gaiellaceae bacterium]|nr:hypothetical protein [Gaiellaceae bacterium]
MAQAAETLERELVRDLETLAERIARDEEFCGDLYRALTNNKWRKDGGREGHVSLSWSRAEELVNDVRVRQGKEPLALAQTGGEGEVSELAGAELGRLGWRATPLQTGEHDAEHRTQPESPPPADQGERMAPVDDAGRWEREAHEEADEYLAEHPAKAVDRTRDARAD